MRKKMFFVCVIFFALYLGDGHMAFADANGQNTNFKILAQNKGADKGEKIGWDKDKKEKSNEGKKREIPPTISEISIGEMLSKGCLLIGIAAIAMFLIKRSRTEQKKAGI